MKKTIVLSLFSFAITCMFLPISKLEAATEPTAYLIDHLQDRKKAKKWAEEHYGAWKKQLTKEEKKSLEQLLQPVDKEEQNNMQHINHQLKVYGGDFSSRPVDIPAENKLLKEHVEHIRRAITRKEGKLSKPLIVYKNQTLKEVAHLEDAGFRNPKDNTLVEENIKQLRKNFLYSQSSEFQIYDLFEDTNQTSTIKWKITLPVGTPTGLIGENKVVIDKNSALKIKQISTIIQKGKQFIRVEANLVAKDIVQNKIAQLTEKIHTDFTNRLQLPPDKKFIDFKLTGSGSFFIAKKLEKMLDKFIARVSPLVIQKTLNFMADEGGHIVLTDQKLYTLPNIYTYERTLRRVIEMMETVGYYNLDSNRTISLHIPYNLRDRLEIRARTLIHELGHAVDNYGGELMNLEGREVSNSNGFKKIFEKEAKNLSDQAKTHPSELFAIAFQMMHTSSEKTFVQQQAPDTCSIIESLLEIMDDPSLKKEERGNKTA